MSRARFRGSSRAALVLLVAAAVLPIAACSREARARRTLKEAAALYDAGRYKEALPLLRRAQEEGLRTGTLLYQIGYCQDVVEGNPAGRRQTWQEAQTLLADEVSRPDGATLETLYDLAVIHSDRQEWDAVKQYGLQAVERFEKGPDARNLDGEDWFRLGRLHDLMVEPSEAEAAYRHSVSISSGAAGGNPIYRSLALAKVGEFDLRMARYPSAAAAFDEALKLFPQNSQVPAFDHGLALLGARRFDEAVARFAADTGPTNTESQYAADLARKAQEVAPINEKDADGTPLASIPGEALEARVKEAARSFRAARDKNSWRPGDPLPAEVAVQQKRFVALLGEYFVRTRQLQEFCLREHVADLVRR